MSLEAQDVTRSQRARSARVPLPLVAAIGVLVAGAVVGMSSVFAWIHNAWYSFAGVGVYSHGYLVLALSAWMGWVYWRADPPRRLAPDWWALAPLIALVAMLALMELLYINSSRALLVPALFLAVTALAFGVGALRRLGFPAMFLYFGLLPWWVFDPPLQAIATRVVESIMRLGNVPAYIEGNFVHIPAGVFEIASACSGLSFFLSAVTLAVFYGAMYLRRWSYRALLLGVAMLAALVSNWIRIWTLILVGQYSEMEHWLIEDHYFYGWVLFVIALAPVLLLARHLEDREYAANAENGGRDDRGDRGEQDAGPDSRMRSTTAVAATIVPAAVVGALLLALPRLFVGEVTAASATEPLPLPERPAAGAEPIDAQSAWRPAFGNAREGRASYAWQGSTIEVYRAVYPEQDRDHHLFLGGNRFHGNEWRPIDRTLRDVTLNGDSIALIEYRGQVAGRERLVWAWYEVAGQPATTRFGAKLAEAAAMGAGRSDGVALAVSTECGADCDRARRQLKGFMQATGTRLQWRPSSDSDRAGTAAQ